jgi:hypothetical protein
VGQQLSAGDDTVLATRKAGDHRVGRGARDCCRWATVILHTPDADGNGAAERPRHVTNDARTTIHAVSDTQHHEQLDEAPEPAALDPETAARRRAALAHIRKFGDPVLRTEARRVEVFDDELRDEIARMGVLMDEAYGVGLAASSPTAPSTRS